ncbi:MAG: hypothetical protein CML22_07095 [Rheinheimera sp.]|nr:hypothetical protein [Rheinheimera sp.]MBM34050.1 hypothetical protein [Rheinheimera sp.]
MLLVLSSIAGLFFGFFFAVIASVLVDCCLVTKGRMQCTGNSTGSSARMRHSVGHNDVHTIKYNPATGLQMVGGGIDAGGNYGFDNDAF